MRKIIFASFILICEIAISQDIVLPKVTPKGGKPLMEVLNDRKTTRKFSNQPIDLSILSHMLWATNGINREDGRRTAPTARNSQEIDIYVFNSTGIYFYDAIQHKLLLREKGDYRAQAGRQDFFSQAPLVFVFVANFDKMKDYDEKGKEFYSATDVGFVSQNLYLYCASENLATVVCGSLDRNAIASLLKITNGKVLLSQPVGYQIK